VGLQGARENNQLVNLSQNEDEVVMTPPRAPEMGENSDLDLEINYSASQRKLDASREQTSRLDAQKPTGSRQSARELKQELDQVNAHLTNVIGKIQQKQLEKAQHMRQQIASMEKLQIEEDSADKVSHTIES
jgi:hypothetical protein